ncbi:hypothetical protein KP79_PYT22708 [Mizuhopecten yessoensis]|uniref:Uncharacterized protein n=1 Tax=Mizuhopecten yessoensis TaxID=6573 RepID=A0A210PS30_MIZYE|nr:hypothetical protein KP79_PYT22708 [Mizuhopecten yessoensis]
MGKIKKTYRMQAERRQKVGSRKKRECPLCMRQVVQVVRHLKEVHGMTAAGAKHEVIGTKAKEAAATNTVKECPIAGSASVVRRLDMHLQKQHKVSPEQSTTLTKMAKIYDEDHDHTELELTQPLPCSIGSSRQPTHAAVCSTGQQSQQAHARAITKSGRTIPVVSTPVLTSYRDVALLKRFKDWLQSIERGKPVNVAV